MAKLNLEPANIVSFFCAFLASVLNIFVIFWHNWVREAADTGIDTQLWDGLFERCNGKDTHEYTCRSYTITDLHDNNRESTWLLVSLSRIK